MSIQGSTVFYFLPFQIFVFDPHRNIHSLVPRSCPAFHRFHSCTGKAGNKAKISKDVHVYYIVYNYTCTFLFHSLLPLGLGMTEIIGISVGGVVACLLLIIVVLIILICCIKTRNQRMTSMPLGAGSPSTKKKPTTSVHELHREELSSPGSEHHYM